MRSGDDTSDRYEMLRLIGAGSHGRVFAAMDHVTGSKVAIKRIPRSCAPEAMGLNELAAAMAVDHPAIVRCLDFRYLRDGEMQIVFDLVEGGSLRERMKEEEPASHDMWLACARDMLSALQHLHERGLIHCDLKPENILAEDGAEKTHFRLADFGVSRLQNSRHKISTPSVGSPAYMAPESFSNVMLPSSDLYGLGVILYELSTGRLPFNGDIQSLARAHLKTTPPLESIENPIQADLIRWLLQKNPDERPATADIALRQLDNTPLRAFPRSKSPSSSPVSYSSVSVPPSLIQNYRGQDCFELSSTASRFHSVNWKGSPGLLAIHESHFEFFCGRTGESIDRFAPCAHGIIQQHPQGDLLIAETNRLVLHEAETGKVQLLAIPDQNPTAAAFHLNRHVIAWVERNHIIVQPVLSDGSTIRFSLVDCPASGLVPRLLFCPADKDALIFVPGAPAPEARWYSRFGDLQATRQLPGLVIDQATTTLPTLFCIENAAQASVLNLVFLGAAEEMEVIPFADHPRFISSCHDGMVIGRTNGDVDLLRPGLPTRNLGKLNTANSTVVFAPDRSYFHRISTRGHQHTCQLFELS